MIIVIIEIINQVNRRLEERRGGLAEVRGSRHHDYLRRHPEHDEGRNITLMLISDCLIFRVFVKYYQTLRTEYLLTSSLKRSVRFTHT